VPDEFVLLVTEFDSWIAAWSSGTAAAARRGSARANSVRFQPRAQLVQLLHERGPRAAPPCGIGGFSRLPLTWERGKGEAAARLSLQIQALRSAQVTRTTAIQAPTRPLSCVLRRGE